jgi:hypothetical protein
MKRLQRDQEKELADQVRLPCAWTQWHAEQFAEALAAEIAMPAKRARMA